MRTFLDGLLLSISFFTKLPTPYHVKNITSNTYKFLALTIPLNGLLLGIITISCFHLLSHFAEEKYVALLASVFYLFMYGFLHLEAVSDIVDAYYGGHGGKDTHEILKDSHVGALGAITTFSLMLLKVAALSYLLIEHNYLGILAILYLSRLMVVAVIYKYNFHKHSTFIHSMKTSLTERGVVTLTLFSLLLLFSLQQPFLIPIGIFFTWLIVNWLIKNIGFLNGDGLGFIIELNELLLLNVLLFT